jgi:IclR family transcriptional regulator, KDG regulon repressor
MSETGGTNVRAVERALQILACFDDEHPERGITDIAQAVKLHKATTHRLVTTLMSFGYIERAEDGQRYRLGLRLADLGYKVIGRMDLRRESQPFMADLTRRLGETSDLCVYDRGQVLYIEMVQGNHTLTIAAAVGRSLPVHATASGKVLLAHLPEQECEAILSGPLARHTLHTITNPETLRRELEVVRTQGYAVDDEELEAGVRAVSVPVRNRDGAVIAAMSIASPASRLTLERIPDTAKELIAVADAVSRRLGWPGSIPSASVRAGGLRRPE